MKVLFINSVVDYGSTGKIVRDLMNHLTEQGHTVLTVYGRHTSDTEENTYSISNKLETAWHIIMTRLFGRHGLHSKRATKKLINKIEEFSPDVIHIHNLHGYYLNYQLLMEYIKVLPNTRVVMTLHDLWTVSGSSAYFSYDGCKLFDKGCVICNNPSSYPKSILLHRQKKNFHDKLKAFSNHKNMEIVTVSKWLKTEIKKTYLNQYPITHIYNGVDIQQFNGTNSKNALFNPNKINLLGVANIWEKRKGLNDFISLSKKLDNRFHITLIGLNEDQISELPQNITGISRTDNSQILYSYYKDADLYLNLSVEETMGLTTIESLAMGTPVIVYDQTAVPEIINESVGIVSPAGDINKLIKNIEVMLERNISEDTCTEFVIENYSKIAMHEKYSKIYVNK